MRNTTTIQNETADSFLDGEFVTTILGAKNYRYLEKAAEGQGVDIETYAQAAILRAVASDLGVAFEGKRLVTLALPAKSAARLRAAAKFEGVSVEEYLLDGLNRDLDLSTDLMATAKN